MKVRRRMMNSPSRPVTPLMTVTVRGTWTKPPVSPPAWQNCHLVHSQYTIVQDAKYTFDHVPLLLFLFFSSSPPPPPPPPPPPLFSIPCFFFLVPPSPSSSLLLHLFLLLFLLLLPHRDQPQTAVSRSAGEGSAQPLHHETTV